MKLMKLHGSIRFMKLMKLPKLHEKKKRKFMMSFVSPDFFFEIFLL